MRIKSKIALPVMLLLFSVVLVAKLAGAQDASPAEQLKSRYKLTKMASDSGGRSVVETGTVLIIQKGGILGVPPANGAMAPDIFKDGELRGPKFSCGSFNGQPHPSTVGERESIRHRD